MFSYSQTPFLYLLPHFYFYKNPVIGDISPTDTDRNSSPEFVFRSDLQSLGAMDRISNLPDELLFQILTFLPTKDAVASTLLSHRWNINQWISLPVFDLQSPDRKNWDPLSFVNLVNNLIRINNSPKTTKFRLKVHNLDQNYLSHINEWIRFASSRGVIELDLDISLKQGVIDDEDDDEVRLRILPCESLEILKISSNFGPHLLPNSFGNIRIFHFEFLDSPLYRELVTMLFTNLPLVHELSIRARLWMPNEEGEITFNVVAPALKNFIFSTLCLSPEAEVVDVKVVVDAPLLEKICLVEDNIAIHSFKTCLNIYEVKICVGEHFGVEDYKYMVSNVDTHNNTVKTRELLRGLSNAKSISLSSGAVLALVISPQIDRLPTFPFLKKLKLFIPNPYCWKLLMPMLVNSPNLQVLVLIMKEHNHIYDEACALEQESFLAYLTGGEFRFIPPNDVPACLLLHLKEIEIWGVEKIEEFNVLKYVVENAKVLEKLIVHPLLCGW